MPRILLGVLAVLVWLAACSPAGRRVPDPERPLAGSAAAAVLGYDDARHLLARTGFGPTHAEIRALVGSTRADAVARILAGARMQAAAPMPAGIERFESARALREGDEDTRRDFVRTQVERSLALRAWWLAEMLRTPSPLTERMTLFWHNHFVSSQEKVKSPALMARQNVLLRRHALGNFARLLEDVARDPAMVVYLDSAQNRKGAPNENFARELMELFTLGEGHYTERDVKEAARAFTGWSLDRATGEFRFRRFAHDAGSKTILGHTGRLDGGDVIRILLERDETAVWVTAKLWREFVSPDPDGREVRRIAARFRSSGYDIRTVLRELLLAEAFWHDGNRGVLVKSPVELVAGTLRGFGVETGDLEPFAFLVAVLGQNLFAPPNVKGWPGGTAWIDATTLLARKQFLDRLFRGQEMASMLRAARPANGQGFGRAGPDSRQRMLRAVAAVHFDAERWRAGFDTEEADTAIRWALALPPLAPLPSSISSHELARMLAQDPVYQLK